MSADNVNALALTLSQTLCKEAPKFTDRMIVLESLLVIAICLSTKNQHDGITLLDSFTEGAAIRIRDAHPSIFKGLLDL